MTGRWDARFLELAKLVGSWSKDPSTKCGCVVVRPNRTVLSVGYNGFPRGMSDDIALYENRTEKIQRIVHAETNALLGVEATGCTLYVWPLLPCTRCATHVIQAGIV